MNEERLPPKGPGSIGGAEARPPWFSIVIPVWNRQDTIRRCLESIFAQGFEDYEVIAVDDASTDETVARMEGYLPERPNLKIVRHERNQGTCATRGTGVDHAAGRWILFFDSDDALRPGALQDIWQRTRSAPEDVGVVGSSQQTDDGQIMPDPPPPTGAMDFAQYLTWVDNSRESNFVLCHRREVYRNLSWPKDRRLETLFQLTLASQWKFMISRKVLLTQYTDAPVRWSTPSRGNTELLRVSAPDLARELDEVLDRFGEVLRTRAPRFHAMVLWQAGKLHLITGGRARGARFMLGYLRRHPGSLTGWALLGLGLLGPGPLLWSLSRKRRR